MTTRIRWMALLAVATVVIAAAATYGVMSFLGYQERQSNPSAVDVVASTSPPTGPRVVFRNTAPGQGYGLVASVALDDPSGERVLTEQACDRVHQADRVTICLRTNRGIATTFEAVLLGPAGAELDSWPLPGIPSRTRVSPDSELVASTSFVTGMAYATVGFSTQTVIRGADGEDFGDLEDFTTLIDGETLVAVDRNFWGVTFGPDGNTFYATAASGSQTWLVRGDLDARTLTSVREDAECPSLSPNGRRIAYKMNTSTGASAHWAIAVLDLTTGRQSILGEQRSVDDQVEWLDDETLLYGLPNPDAPGDSDVWSIPIEGGSAPSLFIPHAWSPAVVLG
ncbi:MAG: hypothetical protein WED09_12340 [Homoserinimonas sp.]